MKDGSGSRPSERNPAASRSRSAIVSETSGGPASRPASASAAEIVDTGAGCWRSFSSAASSVAAIP